MQTWDSGFKTESRIIEYATYVSYLGFADKARQLAHYYDQSQNLRVLISNSINDKKENVVLMPLLSGLIKKLYIEIQLSHN